jgi:hypothetical protein
VGRNPLHDHPRGLSGQHLRAQSRHLAAESAAALSGIEADLDAIRAAHGEDVLAPASSAACSIDYPVMEYPGAIRSHNFDKAPVVEGRLHGIKGQYLLFDTGVINMRKFTGYEIAAET